ncbi:hypothetical protein N0V84_008293 [Fusarium piperis]|uniref:Uncharacterized protein n=1 Tax=Fusarium piperis TaxID=1435070 RepID=A0A9W9BMI4_9HYPO|nr:hypothetical protein N0V84_008293 [Fusarium piperis]
MEEQPKKPKQKNWLRLSRKPTTSPGSEAAKQGPSSDNGSGRLSDEDESLRLGELNVWSRGTHHLVPPPSPQVQRPRLKYMDNPEDEGVICEALAACRDHQYTRMNLRRHVLSGERIPIQRLKRGDVVFLCTTHELYGPGQRRYLYWGTAKSGRQKYLVFLTLVTSGGKGVVRGLHRWFLEPTAYRFSFEPYRSRNAYVSWTRAVAISPARRDSIFGCINQEEQIAKGDLRELGELMVHQMEHHKNDISDLCQLAREPNSSAQTGSRRGDAWLQTRHCGVDGCAFSREVIDAWKESIEKGEQQKRGLTASSMDKSRPPESACRCLGGEARHFDPRLYWLEG